MALSADDPIFKLTPELIEKMSPAARRRALELVRKRRRILGLPDPPMPWGTDEPIQLLRKVAPTYVTKPLSKEHEEIWRWVFDVEQGKEPTPLVVVLPRGRGKSTSLELAVVLLLAHRRRRFCWYVSKTQDLADKHVESIAAILESEEISRHYPGLGTPKVGKFGNQKAWRRQRLTTSSGATVEAVGLNTGTRGVKVEDQRPDLIVLDDIDDGSDSPLLVRKKLEMITQAVIPAGSDDAAIVFVQNMVHKNSLMRRVVEPHSALFTEDDLWMFQARIVGPVPAIEDMEVEFIEDPELGRRVPTIVRGVATWVGQSLESLQRTLRTIGLLAFRREFQHAVDDQPGGMFSHLTFKRCDFNEVPWNQIVATVVAVDPSVTSTTRSDAMGIQVDGVTNDGFIYRFYSWEAISTTTDAIERALLKCYEFKSHHLIVETNNGGDTWGSVFRLALRNLKRQGKVPRNWRPRLIYAKVGGKTSKADRAAAMEPEYARDEIIHVRGTHRTLESALYRFPLTEPDDLVDACFVAGSMVATVDGDKPIEQLRRGDLVWTRAGLRRVRKASVTGRDRRVLEMLLADGRSVTCTPAHRFLTVEGRWVEAFRAPGEVVVIQPQWQRGNPSRSSTAAWFGDGIRMQSSERIASTSGARRGRRWRRTRRPISIDSSGAMAEAANRFRRATTSTTPTMTPSTTTSPTSSASRAANTCGTTTAWSRSGAPSSPITSTRFGPSLPHGTNPTRVAPGTWSMVDELGPDATTRSSPASSAGGSSRAEGQARRPAPMRVASACGVALATLLRRAPSAGPPLPPGSDETARVSRPAVWPAATDGVLVIGVRPAGRAVKVYNLAVEGLPEFYVNGVLAHNCVHSWKWLRRVRGSPGAAALAGADRSGSWAPPSSGGSALTGPSGGRSGWSLGGGETVRSGGFSWRDSGL